MFSSFMPFMEKFGDAVEYNTAYYGALSAVERGALVLRYRGPGFDGESGWIYSGTNINTGNQTDEYLSGFYTYGGGATDMYRKIRSRTTQIPFVGEGNVEKIFINHLDGDSLTSRDYNALDYRISEIIPLGVDDTATTWAYYTSWSKNFKTSWVFNLSGSFRLNPYLVSAFIGEQELTNRAELCIVDSDGCNYDARGLSDLPVVSWSIKGEYDGSQFTLLPKEAVIFGSTQTPLVLPSDTLLRKSKINENKDFILWDNTNPFSSSTDTPPLNIVSEKEQEMSGGIVSYRDLFSDSNTQNGVLNLSLVNFLISNMGGVYPFLEYQFTSETPISDRFFRLDWHGKVGSYDVLIRVYKPTLEQPSVGSFTIIF